MGRTGLKVNSFRLILNVVFVCMAILLFVSPSFSKGAPKVYTKTEDGVTVSVYSEIKRVDDLSLSITIWNIQIVNKSENKFKISPWNISLLIDNEIFKPLPNVKINYDPSTYATSNKVYEGHATTIVNNYILKHNPLQDTVLGPNDSIDGNVFYGKKEFHIRTSTEKVKIKKMQFKMVLPVIGKNENREILINIPVTGKYEKNFIEFECN